MRTKKLRITEDYQLEIDSSDTTIHRHPRSAVPFAEVEVRPGEQIRVSLGKFSKAHPPTGFSIHITPEPRDDSIITEITKLDCGHDECKLVFHIANYEDRIENIEVWQLQ